MSSKTKTTATKEEAMPALVPKLRFPEFRGVALRSVQLGDVTEEGRCRNGKKHSAASVMGVTKANGIVPMEARIVAADIERYKLVEHDWFAYNPMRLNIGSIARWKGDSEILVSPDYVVFKCITDDESGIAPGYLDHFRQTKAWEDFVTEGGDGGVRVRIYYKDIARLQLALPFLPEQQKIAECLSSVDELMAAQARKVDVLKTHKKGLMQQIFPREGETQPRLRFPEFQNAGEWEETTLGQLAKLVRGPFGGSLKKDIFVASGYAVYEQQHAIYSDFSSFSYHITAEKFHELRRFAVAANDLIMSCSGTMGKFAIIPDGVAPGVINQALLKLTPHGFCITKFLKEVLELPSVQQKLLSQSAGGAIQNIVSVDQIKALPQRLPSAHEQQAVVGCLSNLDALITAETQKLEALKTHKKGLMQQFFPAMDTNAEVEA